MSVDFGYWPYGSRARAPPAHTARPAHSAPGRYARISLPGGYVVDGALGMDACARAALESMRFSYNPLPTSDVREFAAFFSTPNLEYLKGEITKRCGGNAMDESEVFDAMMQAYGIVAPRSDITDIERRTSFDDATVQSYVQELNAMVLERTVEENIQANRLWDFYAKNRNGPSEFPDHLDVDTRSRLTASLYPFDWWMP